MKMDEVSLDLSSWILVGYNCWNLLSSCCTLPHLLLNTRLVVQSGFQLISGVRKEYECHKFHHLWSRVQCRWKAIFHLRPDTKDGSFLLHPGLVHTSLANWMLINGIQWHPRSLSQSNPLFHNSITRPASIRLVSKRKSCSQFGWHPFTVIVVDFTFCSLSVTYVSNWESSPDKTAFFTIGWFINSSASITLISTYH